MKRLAAVLTLALLASPALAVRPDEMLADPALEQRARAMGMIPHSVPVFLRLSDGAILGKAIPQVAQAQPVIDPNSTTPMGQMTPDQWTPWIEPGVAP